MKHSHRLLFWFLPFGVMAPSLQGCDVLQDLRGGGGLSDERGILKSLCTEIGGTLCGDQCVKLDEDPMNCGTCGNECPELDSCNHEGRCSADREWALWPVPPSIVEATQYEILGEIARDRTTGLLWQRRVEPQGLTWLEALDYCRELTPDSPVDAGTWRVPTYIELASIIDFSRLNPNPVFEPMAFPETPAGELWAYPGLVNTIEGVGAGCVDPGGDDARAYVRCVAGGSGESMKTHYVVMGDTVLDSKTKLEWQRAPDCVFRSIAITHFAP